MNAATRCQKPCPGCGNIIVAVSSVGVSVAAMKALWRLEHARHNCPRDAFFRILNMGAGK